jgi:hypothetical protein
MLRILKSPRKEGKMAKRNMSILEDVKRAIGIVPEYDVFDSQLIICINSVFSTLHQLGLGPEEGFSIEGSKEEWDEFVDSARFNFVRSYMIMKVHVMFDPPTSSIALEALNKQIEEYEWRMTSEMECYGEED